MKCPMCEDGEIYKRHCKEVCTKCGPLCSCSEPFTIKGIK